MKKPVKNLIPVVILVLLVAIVTIGLFAFGLLDVQKANKKVACNKLPSAEEVQKSIIQHEDAIKELERLSDTNNIWLSIDAERCLGKADIIIYYGTESDRKQIKERIGETFFGVPYRMVNV